KRTRTCRSRLYRKSTQCGATPCPRREGPRRSCETTTRSSCTPSTRSRDPISSRTRTRSSSSSHGARRRSSNSSIGAVLGPAIQTGDGMALAYRAGVPLKDMEMVQFHPTCLPGTGILITEAARGEGGYLINKDGERYMERYLPSKMELGPRDILSRSMIEEIKAGRAFEGPYGPYLGLDLRHLG